MTTFSDNAAQLGLNLSAEQQNKFDVYFRELVDWNTRVNLTAITDYEEARIKHFLDSLTVFSGFDPDTDFNGLKVIDIGTGAGLPGIPMKIARPELSLALLEATAKKTEFLTYITSTLGLKDVTILTGRAEDLARTGKHREQYDAVVSRAVAPLAVLAELTLPFCRTGGRCILPKKGDTRQEIEDARNAIDILGGTLTEIKQIETPGFDDNRHLIIIDKVSDIPDKYPRRPGMPEKRPLK